MVIIQEVTSEVTYLPVKFPKEDFLVKFMFSVYKRYNSRTLLIYINMKTIMTLENI